MKFIITTEGGSVIEMEENSEIEVELNSVGFRITIYRAYEEKKD